MKVVRMRMFTAVFFADITPRKPRIGCVPPPIALISDTVAMIDLGVAQIMKQSTMASKYSDESLERLCPLDAAHAEPEVVIRPEEKVPDQDCLNDEEPRERTAHHRETERLRVSVRSLSPASSRRRAAGGRR